MKRIHYLVLGLLVLAGLMGGLLLIPGRQELALMSLKGKELEAARKSYEDMVRAGDLSPSVVMPLSYLYLQSGNVDEGVRLLESFVHKNPNNLEARKWLGRCYRSAQRQEDYLANLEALKRIDPSEETLRELSLAYNLQARHDKQMAALRELTERFPNNPKDFADLAYLQASQGQLSHAAATLKKLEGRHPNAFTADTVTLFFHLLLDVNQPGEAFQRASAWLAKHPDATLAAYFAYLLQTKGQAEMALRLLAPFEAMSGSHPALLAQLAQLQIATGRRDIAFSRLKGLYDAGHLPESQVASFIDLALEQKEINLALRLAESQDLPALPDWLLARLAQTALSVNRKEFARNLIRRVGEDFLASRPLVAAELALALDDSPPGRAAGRWVSKIDSSTLDPEQKVILAGLYSRVGRHGDAFGLLKSLAAQNQLSDASLAELARLYLRLGKASEGFALFEQLRSHRPSPQIDTGWVVLAAATGRPAAVNAWLNAARDAEISHQLLTDLYHVASDHKQPDLALAVAERLFRRNPGRQERLFLGNALLAGGRSTDALSYLRPLRPGGPEEESTYFQALSAAFAQGASVEEELRDYVAQRLSQPGLSKAQRQELVQAAVDLKEYKAALPYLPELARAEGDTWLYALIEAASKTGRKDELIEILKSDLERSDLSRKAIEMRLQALLEHGGQAVALPYLLRFADKFGGPWAFAYQNALRKLGRESELLAFLKTRAARTDLSMAEKRALAYQLLEAGDKQSSQEIFFELAHHAAPDSPDVSQLLYLWGPHPGPAALDWIESRARASSGSERAAWMKHLINAGAAKRVIALTGNVSKQ